MDDVVNRFARELADSIAAAVSGSAEVEACRERARAAGYEMKVNLEAVVGFVNRGQHAESGDGSPIAPAKALVARKVKLLELMAGAFQPIDGNAAYGEYNVVKDRDAAATIAESAMRTP